MIRYSNALQTAGIDAAAARVRVQLGFGSGWQMVANPCACSDVVMATTANKRHPRRLGQRTT